MTIMTIKGIMLMHFIPSETVSGPSHTTSETDSPPFSSQRWFARMSSRIVMNINIHTEVDPHKARRAHQNYITHPH